MKGATSAVAAALLLVACGASDRGEHEYAGRSSAEWAGFIEDAGKEEYEEAIGKLVGGGQEAVPVVLDLLGMPSPRVVTAASRILSQMDAVVVDPLSELLRTGSNEQRERAAFALGELGTSAQPALVSLRQALGRDEEPGVRARAAYALGYVGREDPETVNALVAAMDDESEEVQRRAVVALSVIGARAAPSVPRLVRALESPTLRGVAVEALGRIGHAAHPAVPELIDALGDSDEQIRFAA
ncbi:MAG: HEAT repeat domain-containing protein, partial [Planctomycetota bacterium]